jgi:hypothetical protein
MFRISRRQVALLLLVSALAATGIALLPGPDRSVGEKARQGMKLVSVSSEEPAPITPLPVASDAMGYRLLMVLNDQCVQRELRLAPRQVAHIDNLVQACLLSAAGLPRDDKSQRDALLREHGNRALDLLTGAERQRLSEIMFQLRSIDIYRDSAFASALDLAPEQRKRLTATFNQTEQAMRKLRLDLKARRIERQDYENAVHRGLVAADQQSDSILTPKQHSLVSAWRGRPIQFGRMHLRLVLRPSPELAAE